jgi:hypothetical protein
MDAGANCRPNVARHRAEPAPHFSSPFFGNTFDSPTPPCVENTHSFVLYIHENYRKAVSSLDAKQKSRNIGDEPIADEWFSGNIRNAVYQIRMDLTQCDQRPEFLTTRGTKFLQKLVAITLDCGTRVILRKTQVQGISAVST